MLLDSHISAYATCLAGKVCGLVRSTWGTSLGEDKLGARARILNTKVARWACARRAPGKHFPSWYIHAMVATSGGLGANTVLVCGTGCKGHVNRAQRRREDGQWLISDSHGLSCVGIMDCLVHYTCSRAEPTHCFMTGDRHQS